ncbi:type III secretion system chaperone [Okeania sp.]|uniref:type III secretion system chaperone n=1 Tax=Okeania sp. TaxID=3100323 RepID=UPI002B4AD061|nr:type III secretion system chaperone [Okeania sp.]MEB3340487.1 type III secretion system chaperone [Okeania sp.]
MNLLEITQTLQNIFGASIQTLSPNSWQIETDKFRLLILISDDKSWLRILIPIAPKEDAQPFFEKLLEANFDVTLETRYAIYENVLWGVFQYNFYTLTVADFREAIQRLLDLKEQGISGYFNEVIENQIRQVIKAAKLQGQTLEATMQTLERFYAEGLMGEIDMNLEYREKTLSAWRYQLERLWYEDN